MHAEWLRFFQGNEHMVPDSVSRLITLQTEMRTCIVAIQFDAQGTVRDVNEYQNNIPDIMVIDSDSDFGAEESETEGESSEINDHGETSINTIGNNVTSESNDHKENNKDNEQKTSQDDVLSDGSYQQCPICLTDCNRKAPVSVFYPCSHFIHTVCLDKYNETVSAFVKCDLFLSRIDYWSHVIYIFFLIIICFRQE